jgi:hypothetical protein
VRNKGATELEQLGDSAVPGLRQRLATASAAEVRQKLSRLLEQLDREPIPSERLRELRTIEVLEGIGTPAAREMLATMAKGAPEARFTRAARAALERWPRQ